MNSLMSSVQVEPATAPPFNDVFYAAVVTVIPVLFLAIAVQGNLYTDLLKFGREASWASWRSPDRPVLTRIANSLAGGGARIVAMLVLAYGVVGEISGLLALYWRRFPSAWLNIWDSPFWAAVFLTVVAAGGPIVAGVRSLQAPLQPGSVRWVVAIVVNAGRVLLVHADEPGAGVYFYFPAVKFKPGQTVEAAAVLATVEQTGLTVTPSRVLGTTPSHMLRTSTQTYVPIGPIYTYVACRLISGIDPLPVKETVELYDGKWRKRTTLEWCDDKARVKRLLGGCKPVINYLDTMVTPLPGKG
jgi:8-oxo-dGTP pyrophosphatase MutT (NUDIX family)